MLRRVPAFGFEDKYLVDRSGQFWHLDGRKKNVQQRRSQDNYLCLVEDRYKDGKRKRKRKVAHRIVWQSFNGPIPDGLMIDHIDRRPENNRLDNLRLVTHRENRVNSKKRSDGKHSKYVGVIACGGGLVGRKDWFRGRVKKSGRQHFTQHTQCETKAALERDRLALKIHGATTSLNFARKGDRSALR